MRNDEFDRLVRKLGFVDGFGLGRLNHWPSGKLYRPMSYYDIKELVEKVLEDRDKTAATYDTRGVDPWDRTTWANARPVKRGDDADGED